MEMYCVAEKKKIEVENFSFENKKTKRGIKGVARGVCPSCGRNIAAITKSRPEIEV